MNLRTIQEERTLKTQEHKTLICLPGSARWMWSSLRPEPNQSSKSTKQWRSFLARTWAYNNVESLNNNLSLSIKLVELMNYEKSKVISKATYNRFNRITANPQLQLESLPFSFNLGLISNPKPEITAWSNSHNSINQLNH